jgi:hypothetical protein
VLTLERAKIPRLFAAVSAFVRGQTDLAEPAKGLGAGRFVRNGASW